MTTPDKIGRYSIQGELGRGAMGVVYRAVDPNIGRTVALKTMRLDVHGAQEQEMLKRFKREAQLAGVMNHPNLVTIYDAGDHEGVFYIAMEFVEGHTLQAILHEERALPPERIIEISRQVCAGLDYAHSHEVVHRDVKPANIMVGVNGAVKIMDFGIAKSSMGMTSAGQVLGTPSYMSPEQVKGRTLDGRSDLFSYGVILYEMVTGEKPFTGQNVTTIIYKIINEQPIAPRELDVSIHPGLSAIVVRCLSKNPEERFQNGAELVKELAAYKSFGGNPDATTVLPQDPSAATQRLDPAQLATMRLAAAPVENMPATAMTIGGGSGAAAQLRPIAEPQLTGASAMPTMQTATATKPAQKLESTVNVSMPAAAKAPTPPAKSSAGKFGIIAVILLALLAGATYLKKHHSAPTSELSAQETQTQPQTSTSAEPTQSAAKPPAAISSAAALERSDADKSAAAKPEKKPLATTGELRVTSTPPGATLSIGGATLGTWKTPYTATRLKPGEYDVVFSLDGYVPATKTIKVVAGRMASVSADLVQKGATVTINSDPIGANIFVDGSPTGQTTPAQLKLDAGDHRIVVRKAGFAEENTAMTLKDGQSFAYSPHLDPAVIKPQGSNPWRALRKVIGGGESIPAGKGLVTIQTHPEGATIFHRGQPSPQTTPMKMPMDPGTYNVVVRLNGYFPAMRQFTVEKGKTTEININLRPR